VQIRHQADTQQGPGVGLCCEHGSTAETGEAKGALLKEKAA
jgi:hypothetical protein